MGQIIEVEQTSVAISKEKKVWSLDQERLFKREK